LGYKSPLVSKIPGFKSLVKDFAYRAKSCKSSKPKVILVNNSSVGFEWNNVFDYQVKDDVDVWSSQILSAWRRKRPEDLMTQLPLMGLTNVIKIDNTIQKKMVDEVPQTTIGPIEAPSSKRKSASSQEMPSKRVKIRRGVYRFWTMFRCCHCLDLLVLPIHQYASFDTYRVTYWRGLDPKVTKMEKTR